MKTTRTYLSGCTWCNARGWVFNPNKHSILSITCPICNGLKTITVTETIEDDITINDLKEIDKSDNCKNCGHQNEEICNTCLL